MIEKTLLAFWGVWLLLILVAAFRVMGFSVARRRQDRRWERGAASRKPVALIVPVKGFDLQSTPRFFDSIFGQNYADYRVIVSFESWSDPVASWLCEHLELGPKRPVWTHPDPGNCLRSVTLVCGGLAQDEGQKVHNQRAAFAELTARDTIVAFVDADILCGGDWLARLVAPINHGPHELSTTYRWLVPKRPTLPSQVASVINASITTQAGAAWCTILWGGSMALSRPVFDELDVPKLLAGSLNDDLRISKAARATGRKIAFVRSLVLPTPVDFTWKTFIEFARRQYTQVKFFSPILYTGINFVLGFYALGALSIIAALVYGYFFAWIPVAAAYVIDQFRSLFRQQIYLSLFPDNGIRQKLFASAWLEHMLTPFWMLLHWFILASTWTQNRITWAGVSYRILSNSKTRVLQRDSPTVPLPAGAPGLAMITALRDRRRGEVVDPFRNTAALTKPVAATVTFPPPGPEVGAVGEPSAAVATFVGRRDPDRPASVRETSSRVFTPKVFPSLRKPSASAGRRARDPRPAAERALSRTKVIRAPLSPVASVTSPQTSAASGNPAAARPSPRSSAPAGSAGTPPFRPRTAAQKLLAAKSRIVARFPGVSRPDAGGRTHRPLRPVRPRTGDLAHPRSPKEPSLCGFSESLPHHNPATNRLHGSVEPERPPRPSASWSIAARRAVAGSRPAALPRGRCAPASSLHPVPGTCVGLRPSARPLSRGPSSRP